MNTCRVCKEIKENSEFIMRGTQTQCCIECSKDRKTRDYCQAHNRRQHDCYLCVDPLVRRASSMVTGSRVSDKKKGRICTLTFTAVLDLVMDTRKCTYCDIELQYCNPYIPDFCTIDRIDNRLGHTIENCLISCRQCNCGQRKYLTPNYYQKYILKEIL
jgi:hypothetical protein